MPSALECMGFVSAYWLMMAAMAIITIGEMFTVPVAQTIVSIFAPEEYAGQLYGYLWLCLDPPFCDRSPACRPRSWIIQPELGLVWQPVFWPDHLRDRVLGASTERAGHRFTTTGA